MHRQYADPAGNKQIRTSSTYRLRDKERIFDPVQVEFEKAEDTSYL